MKKPVPTLLTATNHTLQFFHPDHQLSFNEPLATSDIVSMTFIAFKFVCYWLDNGGRLMKLSGEDPEGIEVSFSGIFIGV